MRLPWGGDQQGYVLDHRLIIVSNNIIEDLPFWNGLDVHGGSQITFRGNLVQGCLRGIEAVLSYSNSANPHLTDVCVTDNIFIGNASSGSGYNRAEGAIFVGGSVNSPMGVFTGERFIVTGNKIQGYNPRGDDLTNKIGGIEAVNIRDFVISHNVIFNNAGVGISLVSSPTAPGPDRKWSELNTGMVSGNVIVGKETGETQYGIAITGPDDDGVPPDACLPYYIEVVGNVIRKAQYGVWAKYATRYTGLTNNNLKDCFRGAVQDPRQNWYYMANNIGIDIRL